MAGEAADLMAGYLIRSSRKRPEVTLKLAVSSDGMIGRRGEGQVAVTGPVARAQAHLMRAASDAILVGIGTALADDPALTCRLPGLERRSPLRVVLDPHVRLSAASKLARTARGVPVLVAAEPEAAARAGALAECGVEFIGVEMADGAVALPELMEDLAARGISTVLVEGGAETARRFLAEGLVDRIALFTGPGTIGAGGIPSPVARENIPEGFALARSARYGDDAYEEFTRQT